MASKFSEETRLRNKMLKELKRIREQDITKVKKRNETSNSSIDDDLDADTRQKFRELMGYNVNEQLRISFQQIEQLRV